MFQYPCKCARCRSPTLPSSPRKHKFSPNHLLSQLPSCLLLLSHSIKFSRRSCLARACSLYQYRDCSSLTSFRLYLTRLSPSLYALSPPLSVLTSFHPFPLPPTPPSLILIILSSASGLPACFCWMPPMESLKTKNLLKMSLHTVGHVVDTQQKPDGEILRFVLFEGFLEGFSQLDSMRFYLKVMVMLECNTTKFAL